MRLDSTDVDSETQYCKRLLGMFIAIEVNYRRLYVPFVGTDLSASVSTVPQGYYPCTQLQGERQLSFVVQKTLDITFDFCKSYTGYNPLIH